ncbi:hypothetical protein JCM8115_005800 [Rhodotorula mucilaginosa]
MQLSASLVLLFAAHCAVLVQAAPALLDVRGIANCKGPFQCRFYPRPENSFATCVDNECGWRCDDGFTQVGRTCTLITTSLAPVSSTSSTRRPSTTSTKPSGVVGPPQTTKPATSSRTTTTTTTTTTTSRSTTKKTTTTTKKTTTTKTTTTTTTRPPSSTAPPPTTTTTSPPPPTATTTTTPITTTTTEAPAPTVTLLPNAVAAAGVTGFLGVNKNAIISWFRTDASQDSTNGHSWCGSPYTDAVPGFAPSLKTMLSNFNWDYEAAAKAYCGLEAIVTTPDGRTATLYLADAFDDTWVRTPSSIDVVIGSFAQLFGRETTNKNDVVKDGSWYFTGNRNERYKFKGLGAVGL